MPERSQLRDRSMFARRMRPQPDHDALMRIESAVRDRYRLGPDEIVLVSREATRLPGEPDVATTILFWFAGQRHRLRIFKPPAAITATDLPPAWIRATLLDDGQADCC